MKDAFKSIYSKLKSLSASNDGDKREEMLESLFPKQFYFSEEQKKKFEEKLNIKISKIEYFEQALTHRSFCQLDHKRASNERLEFLGDAALGLVVAEYLFYRHKELPEGELTKIRSWLVNKHALANCAKELELADYIRMSYSAASSIDRGSESILADCLEAIIAAIFLDKGFSAVKKFITVSLLPIMFSQNALKDDNYKSLLLEKAQADGFEYPKYIVLEESGPDHDKFFKVEAVIENVPVATGEGKSKKQAEQNAAQNALENYNLSYIKARLEINGKADN